MTDEQRLEHDDEIASVITSLQAQLDTARRDLKMRDTKIADLEAQLHWAQRELDTARQTIEELRESYRTKEPCGHAKNFLIGDDYGHFTCTVCSLDTARQQMAHLNKTFELSVVSIGIAAEQRDEFKIQLQAAEKREERLRETLIRIAKFTHETYTAKEADAALADRAQESPFDESRQIHCEMLGCRLLHRHSGSHDFAEAGTGTKTMSDEPHPCDEALSNIHSLAIGLEMGAETNAALMLAKAHEQIQQYLIGEDGRIDAAVTAEKEAIAKMADDAHDRCVYDTFAGLAAAIRARGAQEPKS